MNQRKNQKNKNPIIGGRKFKKKTFMTNDKLKQTIFILVVTIVLLFTTLAIVITTHRTRKQPVPQPQTIVITDTISKVVFDTVYIDHFVTKKLQLTDTLYIDSVKIDSVFVQVPISTYKLDTTFCTDSTRLDLHIINSGYDVKLDSLFYRLEYKPTTVVPKKNYFREHFRFGLGVSAGYGFFTKQPDIFVGLGFYYVF